MKHKMFYVWLMIAFFAFVSTWGCGGSSTSSSDSPEEPTAQSSLSMKEAITSDDIMQKIYDQVVSDDLVLFGLSEVKVYMLAVSGDGKIWAGDVSLTVETITPAPYEPEELRRHYESEDVILLAEADIDFINKIRTDLGEVSEDASIVGQSGYLEGYAMARILSGNAFRKFTYTIPTMHDIISTEGTSSEQDSVLSVIDTLNTEGVISTDDEAVYTALDFVVERWVNFYVWCSAFGLRNFFGEGLMSAAADKVTEEADRQDYTFDFSYTGLKAAGITYDDWNKSATAFTLSRTNSLNLKVYSAHSFQTGNDYYFVQSRASTTPKNYKSTKVSPTGSASSYPYLYGYTKYLGFEAWLDGSTANNVSIAKSSPGDMKGNPASGGAEYNADTTYSINRWTGLHQYTGPFAVNGVDYSNSQTWTLKGWDMVNNTSANHPASAGWYADVYLPAIAWGTLIPSAGSTGTLSFNTDWVWEVKPDFWKANKAVKMNVDFEVRDGATITGTKNGDASKWFGNKRTASVFLTPPPHVSARLVGRSLSMTGNSLPLFLYNLSAGLSKQEIVPFSYTLDEKADTLTLKVLAEEPWTLTYKTNDGGNWATLSSTSGTATGADGQDVIITVQENKSKMRMLHIDIQSGQEHAKVNILQNI